MKAFIKKLWDSGILKFAGSSFLCWSTDQIIAAILADWLLPLFGITEIAVLAQVSGYTARVISASMNFLINRGVVFREDSHFAVRAVKYAVLAVFIITMSNLGVIALVRAGMIRAVAKVICDCILFFVNFAGQRLWVFRTPKEKKAE